jgi:hypothetical protein
MKTLPQPHAGEKPFAGQSKTPKTAGWCKTPHAYFLEWRRHFTALEVSVLGVILDRTVGKSTPKHAKEWMKASKADFGLWTGKSPRQIQRTLASLKSKSAIRVVDEKGGRGVEPSYQVDLQAVEKFVRRGQKCLPLSPQKGDKNVSPNYRPRTKTTDQAPSVGACEALFLTNGGPPQRITGDESQKTAIPTPGAVVGEFANGEEENRKADRPSVGGENIQPISGKATPAELERLRAFLFAYFDCDEPPPRFEQSCVLRARGASVAQIIEFLQRLWAKKKYRPGGSKGPHEWNWFLTVIGNEFSAIERGRWPEPIAPAHPSNTASAEEIARGGIETLEVPDAEDSWRSTTCQCGAEIRQYTSGRVEGECRCPSKRAPGRVTAATLGKVLAGKRIESRAAKAATG